MQVAVLDDNGKEIVTLGSGSFFGEIAVLSSTERTASILTKTYCHVLVLSKADFASVGELFPESVKSVSDQAQSRIAAVQKIQEEARRKLLSKVLGAPVHPLQPRTCLHMYPRILVLIRGQVFWCGDDAEPPLHWPPAALS